MALTVEKSMEVADFWECWEHIKAPVEAEYKAVQGRNGWYEFHLKLIWDCEEDQDEQQGR